MTSLNKRYSRSVRSSLSSVTLTNDAEGSEEKTGNLDENQVYTPLPKHIPFPDVPHSSEIVNELFIFLFTLVAAGAQFMHLYRTVWWLPDSFTNHTINIYLIDPYLAMFIVVVLGRRFIYCIITKLLDLVVSEKMIGGSVYSITRIAFFQVLVILLGGCTLKIFQNHSYVYTICLCYPLVLYAAIFGLQIQPFLRTVSETESQYLNQFPLHCCSTSPNYVRTEVDTLIADFNKRFKQVIFTSVVNAYYAGFIPCFFAQKYLYYDIYWTIQHLAFIWTGVFGMGVLYCFPAKYSDILHRACLHLGQWNKVTSRTPYNLSTSSWSKTVFWPHGSLVKHSDKIFKSVGHITSAIPYNSSHYRFYLIFQNPSMLYMILTIIQLVIVVAQMFILYFNSLEWHNTISLTFIIFVNYTILFKLCRDYLVTQKIYIAESSIYKKLSTSVIN